jgi:hypothetical protein
MSVLTTILASGATGPKTLWDPTIVGILAVVSGVFLFCGSTYLLLSTNVGARLGFLISASGLMGIMVVLSLLWISTNTPLNSPKGREGTWDPIEVVDDPANSSISAVHDILEEPLLPAEDAATVKPAADAALVTVSVAANEEAPEQPLVKYSQASEYLTEVPAEFSDDPDSAPPEDRVGMRQVGGGTKNVFWHHPWYSVVEFCDVAVTPDDPTLDLGEVPDAECKPGAPHQFLVLQRDYGSIRLPPAMYLMGSILLFILSLLGLHWYEKDLRARRRAAAGSVLAAA